jgi:hypothetical protein
MITRFTISPFQGLVSWCGHNSEGRYHLAGGLRPYRAMMLSPEGATYNSEAATPLAHKKTTISSPEGAIYANDGYSPSDKKKKSITSPEGA